MWTTRSRNECHALSTSVFCGTRENGGNERKEGEEGGDMRIDLF